MYILVPDKKIDDQRTEFVNETNLSKPCKPETCEFENYISETQKDI